MLVRHGFATERLLTEISYCLTIGTHTRRRLGQPIRFSQKQSCKWRGKGNLMESCWLQMSTPVIVSRRESDSKPKSHHHAAFVWLMRCSRKEHSRVQSGLAQNQLAIRCFCSCNVKAKECRSRRIHQIPSSNPWSKFNYQPAHGMKTACTLSVPYSITSWYCHPVLTSMLQHWFSGISPQCDFLFKLQATCDQSHTKRALKSFSI